MTLSVVVTTYNWPEALDLVLCALAEQTDPSFEVVVADDGSRPETADVVRRRKAELGDRLVHVWQRDEGWRKSSALNLGALHAHGDFLVFMDGDCIPRTRFVRAVRRAALPGWFLATKRVYLSHEFSAKELARGLPIWSWSTARWMARHPDEVRRPGYLVPLRDRRRPWRARQPDFVPPDNGFGFFFGLHRADFERVNGWDMRFTGWGCEDTDLAYRVRRLGLRCGWPGPDATMFHLWHAKASEHENEPLLFDTRDSNRIEAVTGLKELAAQIGLEQSGFGRGDKLSGRRGEFGPASARWSLGSESHS